MAPFNGTSAETTLQDLTLDGTDMVISGANPEWTLTAADAGAVMAWDNTTGVLAASASNWTPSAIVTSAWFDAADNTTITEVSGKVSQWNDKSGNDNHATQSYPPAQPILSGSGQTAAIAGSETVYMTMANQILSSGNEFSVFYVGTPSETGMKTIWLKFIFPPIQVLFGQRLPLLKDMLTVQV